MANQMRGKVEAAEYKNIVLGLIFYKFCSEREVAWLKAKLGFEDGDFASDLVEDDVELVEECQWSLGYFIAYGNLWSTMRTLPVGGSVNRLRDAINAFDRLIEPSSGGRESDGRRVFGGSIGASGDRHVGTVFEALNIGLRKLPGDRDLRDLMDLLDLISIDGRNGYDELGYIYEFLIGQFAMNAGKKAGEYYTPSEVSTLMSRIVAQDMHDRDALRVYDPTSGSASLLLRVGREIARVNKDISFENISYYAQELVDTSYDMTRMNLVMHGVLAANIHARNADTLADDWPMDGTSTQPLRVDVCVSNPPYSARWDNSCAAGDVRFSGYGVAPSGKADYAFLLHNLAHLAPDGIMCIVLPHGVLFRGSSEADIRRRLVEEGNIDAVIGLPANMFYGTGIPTIVMVVRKTGRNDGVLMIDASRHFVKDGKQNRLRESDVQRIVDAWVARGDVEGFCHLAGVDEIRANGFNLNIPRYVDSSMSNVGDDLMGLMGAGIPSSEIDLMGKVWDAFPDLRGALFEEVDGYGRVLSSSVSGLSSVEHWWSSVIGGLSGGDSRGVIDVGDVFCDGALRPADEVRVRLESVRRRILGVADRLPLVDHYEVFELLHELSERVERSLEAIGDDGIGAIRAVEENMSIDKNGVEVVDRKVPWRGRVVELGFVAEMLDGARLAEMKRLEDEARSLASELSGLLEQVSQSGIVEVADEQILRSSDLARVRKVVAQGFDDDVVSLVDDAVDVDRRRKAVERKVRAMRSESCDCAKALLEGLSDKEAVELLVTSWTMPYVGAIERMVQGVVSDIEGQVRSLEEKYRVGLSDVDGEIAGCEAGLCDMLLHLSPGDAGVAALMGALRGSAL